MSSRFLSVMKMSIWGVEQNTVPHLKIYLTDVWEQTQLDVFIDPLLTGDLIIERGFPLLKISAAPVFS